MFSGPALLLRASIKERGEFPVLIARDDFPCGILDPFMIGEEIDVVLKSRKDSGYAEALPFDNQSTSVKSKLLSLLMHTAEQAGQEKIELLPLLPRKISLKPRTDPEVTRRLEELFKLDIDPESVEKNFFPDDVEQDPF